MSQVPDHHASFAANLQRLRIQQSLTQKNLADAAYMAQQRVSEFERLKADPKLSQLRDLAQALGVEVVRLLE